MKPPKKAIKPMMIRNKPCIPNKATTITLPGRGFLRDACNDVSLFIDRISPMQKLGPGGTSRRVLQTQRQSLRPGTGVSVDVTCCPGNGADGCRGDSSGGYCSGCSF